MKFEMEDMESVLFDGDEEQMADIHAGLSYDYGKAQDPFEVRYGKPTSRSHGLHLVPECVAL